MMKVGRFFKENWIRMIIAFVVGSILMVIYNASYASTGADSWGKLEYYRDGSFIAAMSLLFVGLLALISHFGVFDIFSFYPMRKTKENGKKENFGDYVTRKNEARGHLKLYFLSYIIIAFVYGVFAVIAYIILK